MEAAGGVPLLELTEIARHRARPGRRDAHYSVNANERDWRAAVEQLDRARSRWGDTLEAFVGLRVPMDRFAEAFDFAGVKATLRFD